MQGELIIVGGGIAGLTTAELFQRSGWQVTLVERESKLCQGSSGKHHEWFHLGSLYASFNADTFLKLIENAFQIVTYYKHMRGMNMRIEDNKFVFTNQPSAWFRDETFDYFIKNLPYDKRPVTPFFRYLVDLCKWKLKNFRFFSCHNAMHRDLLDIPLITALADYLLQTNQATKNANLNLQTNNLPYTPGLDRTMNSTNITADLTYSFLHHGGKIKTNHQLIKFKNKNKRVSVILKHHDEQIKLDADRLILTMGMGLNKVSQAKHVNTVISPLLVAYPEVHRRNFVIVADKMEDTINHLHHRVDDKVYSVIGGGYFADPNDQNAIKNIKQNLIQRAQQTFIKLKDSHTHIYLSHKTEILSPHDPSRNYVYQIKKINKRIFYAVPGKASLAFSLAIDLFKKLNPNQTPVLASPYSSTSTKIENYFERMMHAKVVSALINKKRVVNE